MRSRPARPAAFLLLEEDFVNYNRFIGTHISQKSLLFPEYFSRIGLSSG
jgi:hypothetical protein